MNSFLTKISPQITAELIPSKKFLIAFSGGSDSVFLTHLMLKILPPKNLVLVHFNHHLRENDSDHDAKFSAQFAKKLKLKFHLIDLNPSKLQKGNLEGNSRKERYEHLEKLRLHENADWILTAHHQNDQIETILLNICRGVNLYGLKGIKSHDPNRYLLRPLLNIAKTEISNYLKQNRLKFCLDRTNEDLKFKRNLLRHKVLPELQKINSNFNETFLSSVDFLQQSQEFIEAQAENFLQTAPNFLKTKKPQRQIQIIHKSSPKSPLIQFSQANFLNQPQILKQSILIILFKRFNHGNLTAQQINEIIKTLNQPKSGLKKEFGKEHWIIIKI